MLQRNKEAITPGNRKIDNYFFGENFCEFSVHASAHAI